MQIGIASLFAKLFPPRAAPGAETDSADPSGASLFSRLFHAASSRSGGAAPEAQTSIPTLFGGRGGSFLASGSEPGTSGPRLPIGDGISVDDKQPTPVVGPGSVAADGPIAVQPWLFGHAPPATPAEGRLAAPVTPTGPGQGADPLPVPLPPEGVPVPVGGDRPSAGEHLPTSLTEVAKYAAQPANNDGRVPTTTVDPDTPALTDPVKPALTDPVKPALADPIKPTLADPVKPALADPVKPALADPVKPALTDPVKPALADPIKPTLADPVKPALADPVKPALANPVKPTLADPVKPTPVDVTRQPPAAGSGTDPAPVAPAPLPTRMAGRVAPPQSASDLGGARHPAVESGRPQPTPVPVEPAAPQPEAKQRPEQAIGADGIPLPSRRRPALAGLTALAAAGPERSAVRGERIIPHRAYRRRRAARVAEGGSPLPTVKHAPGAIEPAPSQKPAAVVQQRGAIHDEPRPQPTTADAAARRPSTVARPFEPEIARSIDAVQSGGAATDGRSPTLDPTALPRQAGPVRHEAMLHAIMARVQNMQRPGNVELRFALAPPGLGNVRVKIQAVGDQLRVKLVAGSTAAAELLSQGLTRLTGQLNQAGFPQAEVTLGLETAADPSTHGGQQRDPGGHSGNNPRSSQRPDRHPDETPDQDAGERKQQGRLDRTA